MSSYTLLPILVLAVVLFAASPAAAFGSGLVSEASGVHNRVFLHGDVEGILTELVKTAAGAGAAGIMGAIFSGGKKAGKKFSKDDVSRVYFGNWLRDLSQAVDVASLKLLPAQRIVNVVAVLGFLEFGYATREFEVTPERLGNYLTVEHIDNPTGYPDDQGSDPRQVANYPGLRGPLNPRELDIDERNGMKQYIATEGRDFDTSARFIKDNIIRAIELGRSGRRNNERDEWESLRLLGTALHTLEDFAAHSNFIEVALQKLGYDRVFAHVGDRVRVRAPSGREVAPIVTGSFGGADFMHSMLGTAEDKLSQNSAQDVTAKFDDNKGKDGGALRTVLKLLLSKDDKADRDGDGGDGGSDTRKNPDGQVDRLEELRRRAQEMNPTDIGEDEVHQFIMDVLGIHDDIARTISGIIDRIPGLDELLGEVSNNLAVFVFSTLEPVMSPIFRTVTETLFEASAAVVDCHDQTIVFNDENASDPTHSMLAKDHFSNLLNAPAGRLAQIIVRHSVQQVVEAWDDDGIDPRQVADRIVTALHHPDFVERPNPVQEDMLRFVDTWINSHGGEKDEVLRRLEKNAVLEHRNITDGLSGGSTIPAADANANKYAAASEGLAGLVKPGGVLADAPGADVVAGVLGTLKLDGSDDKRKGQQHGGSGQQYGQQQHGGSGQQYGQQQQQYGQGGRRNDDEDNDGGRRYQQQQQQFGGGGQQSFGQSHSQQYGGGGRRNDEDDDERRQQQHQYGDSRRQDDEDNSYGSGRQQQQYGGYGEQRRQDDDGDRFGRQESYGQQSHGQRRDDEDRFGGDHGRRNEYGQGQQRYGGEDDDNRRQGYGQQQSYGYGGGRNNDDDNEYGQGGRQTSSGYGGGEQGRDDYGGRQQQSGFGNDEGDQYGGRRGGGGDEGYGNDDNRGGRGEYGQPRRDDDERQGSYGRRDTADYSL
ncbi:uncharacterized protein PSFLO_02136 [Pseudozyma flocculosa]|uniref:Het-C-domain-containing protein n=1 Tax=Pseudozyma flocculosa TaxID=84751 RepID=A0A5C3EY15_9BASI|nr:uncharacterized protein PSFLO_02136 [Pseudozyma flocculosa]